jgi:NhaA family Na+:H+ antiporter
MATDIAFALGILSLLGNRVPISLKIFLMALAIADDLGAVLVIALFYTSNISFTSLGTGAAFMVILIAANAIGIRKTLFYGIVGIGGLWLAFLMSGVHATIAGVLAALTIPARTKIDEISFANKLKEHVNNFLSIPPNDVTLLEPEQMHFIHKIQKLTHAADTPLQRLEHTLHPFVSFIIMPLFALSNAGVVFGETFIENLFHPVSLGIMTGLVLGKFAGVVGMCFIFIKMKWAKLPNGVKWKHLFGAAFLAGVGFTMSMFVTNLAFSNQQLNELSKAAILLASLSSGVVGYLLLRSNTK